MCCGGPVIGDTYSKSKIGSNWNGCRMGQSDHCQVACLPNRHLVILDLAVGRLTEGSQVAHGAEAESSKRSGGRSIHWNVESQDVGSSGDNPVRENLLSPIAPIPVRV